MGLFSKEYPPEVAARVPPGNRLVKTWPVLHYGPIPAFDGTDWDLEVKGLLENPFTLSYPELTSLPTVRVDADMHCVTGWTTLDNTWEGVSFRTIVERAAPLHDHPRVDPVVQFGLLPDATPRRLDGHPLPLHDPVLRRGLGMDFQLFTLLPLRFWGRMTNFILLSVPLFIFMGVFLEKSGIAEELLDVMADIFGRLRGGVAISIVMVGAVLAASTGVMGATCITMGIISLPQMLKRGDQHELAAGTICASATLGQIIPPSLSLILVADVMGVPVGDIYAGAVIPIIAGVFLYLFSLGRYRGVVLLEGS